MLFSHIFLLLVLTWRFFDTETTLRKGRLLTVIPALRPQFEVSFDMYPLEKISTWTGLLHMTVSGNDDFYRSRVPGIFYGNLNGVCCGSLLQIGFAINNHKNYIPRRPSVDIMRWTRVVVKQVLVNDDYVYMVLFNGIEQYRITNTETRLFKNVRVYVTNPWAGVFPGKIRNLTIIT